MLFPDLRAFARLAFDRHTKITGIRSASYPTDQSLFDKAGMWWAVPIALGESGCTYALRLSPGPGHGAVLRCLDGHAVTIAATPDRAILAMLAIERLLVGAPFRTKLVDGWAEVRDLLREAMTIVGAEPDALDGVLHVADRLPNWVAPAPLEQEEQRRKMLWQITHDAPVGEAWSRSNDSRLAPTDAEASLRLLQGNHGLDGTRRSAGLMPGSSDARNLLVAAARRVRESGGTSDPTWAAVIEAIAEREQPTPDDFIPAVGATPTKESWDAWAAMSFWFKAVGGSIPNEHVEVAEQIAEALGADEILAVRHL